MNRMFLKAIKSVRASTFILAICCMAVVDTGLAFHVDVHSEITIEQLEGITHSVFGTDQGFSEQALEEVAEANVEVDDPLRLGSTAAIFSPEFHFTNERLAHSFMNIENLRTQIIGELTRPTPNGQAARRLLGRALHPLQDFYSHSTWVELGNGTIVLSTFPNPPASLQPCAADPNTVESGGGGGLTSAYFVDDNPKLDAIRFKLGLIDDYGCEAALLPTGKCFHGNYSTACTGINKDLSVQLAAQDSPGVPASPLHPVARSLAEQATLDFVENMIISDLAGNDAAIAALFSVKGTVGFVVDDTGSMGDDIQGVRTSVNNILTFIATDPRFTSANSPSNFLLTRFGDPSVGPTLVTEDPYTLIAAVNALSPAGGGDCPEFSQAALLQAIDKANFDSQLMLYTDASAKDSGLVNSVLSQAQGKKIRLNYVLTGSCSPIDPAYVRGAQETGGQILPITRSEVGDLFEFFKPQILGNLVTLTAGATTAGPVPDLRPIVVDSTISNLVVTSTFIGSVSVELRRPNGMAVDPSDSTVSIKNLSGASIVSVESPESGTWNVGFTGSAAVSFVAEGNSPLELRRFEFVDESIDIHGGHFKIDGQPLSGDSVIAKAKILGPFMSASFELVSEMGIVLAAIDLNQGTKGSVRSDFIGGFDLPTEPFRVVVNGLDGSGVPFTRLNPTVFRPQSLGVIVSGGEGSTIASGEMASYLFEVTNIGTTSTFLFAATDSLAAINAVSPTSSLIGQGETVTVTVDIHIPEATEPGTREAITLTATRADDTTQFNSASIEVTVVDPVLIAGADVNPQQCPSRLVKNPRAENSQAKDLHVAILGSAELDVWDIDVSSVLIAGVPVTGFVVPPGISRSEVVDRVLSEVEDVATPFELYTGKTERDDCTDEGPDSWDDLVLKVNTQDIIAALEPSGIDNATLIEIEGVLLDGTPFRAEDVVVIRRARKR